MNKYKKLVSNSFLFAIGNLGSKMINFILLPLYTYTLTTQQYGTADLIQTTVSLFLPVISLNIFDGVLRFVMDRNENPKKVLNVGSFITLISSVICLILAFIGHLLGIRYSFYVVGILIVNSIQSLFSQYLKGIGKVKLFALNGILTSIFTATLNVILLVGLRMGLIGYLLAIMIGQLLSDLYLFFAGKLYRTISFSRPDKTLSLRMLTYSTPLIPNSIAWWTTNTVSRYFVAYFIGAAANGIFAVSNKIPSLLSVLNSIFFQSWQLSAIEEFKSKDNKTFFTNIFKMYSQLLFLGTSGILLILKPLLSLIVSDSFYVAWKYVPFLLLSVVYSGFSSFLGQYYIAAKKTAGVFSTTIYSAVINVVFNFLLIPHFKLFGAAISSMLSYLALWIIRNHDTQKFLKSKIDLKNILLNHLVITSQIFFLFFPIGNIIYTYVIESVMVVLSFIINRSLLKTILSGLLKQLH